MLEYKHEDGPITFEGKDEHKSDIRKVLIPVSHEMMRMLSIPSVLFLAQSILQCIMNHT